MAPQCRASAIFASRLEANFGSIPTSFLPCSEATTPPTSPCWRRREANSTISTPLNKRSVFALMSDSFAWDTPVPAGELALLKDTGETIECELILMRDMPTKLPPYLAAT